MSTKNPKKPKSATRLWCAAARTRGALVIGSVVARVALIIESERTKFVETSILGWVTAGVAAGAFSAGEQAVALRAGDVVPLRIFRPVRSRGGCRFRHPILPDHHRSD